VVPRANVPALDAGSRNAPGEAKAARDLNRSFPGPDGPNEARSMPATALWAFVSRQRADWLVDLHEGFGVRAAGSESVGSSIIHHPGGQTRRMAEAMLDAVNATIDEADRKFVLLRPPAKGSLARAAADRLGARAMILETTYKGQPLALRVRQLRLMVHCLLRRLEMTDCSVDQVLPPRAGPTSRPAEPAEPVRVAVYNGGGSASQTGPLRLERIVTAQPDAAAEIIGPEEVRSGALRQFDVVLFPGGSGSKQAAALGDVGREAVRKFTRAGGGYVGICAGAYLATYRYSWSLRIVNVKAIDTKHWRRGTGVVKMELSGAGREMLGGPEGEIDIQYANGPILAPAEANDLPPVTVLAHFRTEKADHGAPKGVMTGTPAAVSGTFGRGRVVIFSPHPDKTEPLYGMVRRAVQWAARRERQLPRALPVR
ncbi:MAG: BPL-N domain-containing protein, partial [Phycisphaerae bacterium]